MVFSKRTCSHLIQTPKAGFTTASWMTNNRPSPMDRDLSDILELHRAIILSVVSLSCVNFFTSGLRMAKRWMAIYHVSILYPLSHSRQLFCNMYFYFLHDRPWISPWIKSISNELDIICHVFASQLPCCAIREINTKITLLSAHKQFATRVHTLFSISMYETHIIKVRSKF